MDIYKKFEEDFVEPRKDSGSRTEMTIFASTGVMEGLGKHIEETYHLKVSVGEEEFDFPERQCYRTEKDGKKRISGGVTRDMLEAYKILEKHSLDPVVCGGK